MSGHANEMDAHTSGLVRQHMRVNGDGTQAEADEIQRMSDAQILEEFDRGYPGGAGAAIRDIQEESGRHGQ